MLLQNVLLALVWVALTGELTAANFLEGILIGFVLLTILGRTLGSRDYFSRVLNWVRFGLFFGYSLTVASLKVVYTVVSPRLPIRPAVVAIPLDLETDVEITLLGNLITLTPGTLTLDVSADRKTIYVHTIHVGDDVEAFKQEIKTGFERRIMEVMR